MSRTALGWLRVMIAFLIFLAPAARAGTIARVSISPVDGGMEAMFTLPEPMRSVRFTNAVEIIRDDAWHIETPGVELKHGAVTREDGGPLQTFVVKLTPDTVARDRTYPSLTSVGEGWQLYGPYLMIQGIETLARIDLPKAWTTVPAGPADIDPQGYLYVGPRAYLTDGAAVVIAPASVSSILKQTITQAADQAAFGYQRGLGLELGVRPTVIVALEPAFEGDFQGDTTDGPVVSLRFFGRGWETPDAKSTSVAVRFVYHEFFHLWNARLARSRLSDQEAWLHEGMAEYAALISSAANRTTDELVVRQELETHLNQCARVQRTSLTQAPPREGENVYDCGVLAQWAADLDARASGKDVFAVWGTLFSPAADHRREYDAARFAALFETGRPGDPLTRLMAPTGSLDWDGFVAEMNALGAKIRKVRRPSVDRSAMLMHLERQVCGPGSLGFWTNSDSLTLDTGSRCGPLNGHPKIDHVAGTDVMADPSKAFDKVVTLCAAGDDVVISRGDRLVATIPCKSPLQPFPAWSVDQRN